MDVEPAQTITAEELDVRLRFMMATRGNVTGPFVVRASRTLLRMWDAVSGKPVNNEQHIKQNNIGTKTLQKRVNSIHATWTSAVLPKQTLGSSALRQCFCINQQLPTSLFE